MERWGTCKPEDSSSEKADSDDDIIHKADHRHGGQHRTWGIANPIVRNQISATRGTLKTKTQKFQSSSTCDDDTEA